MAKEEIALNKKRIKKTIVFISLLLAAVITWFAVQRFYYRVEGSELLQYLVPYSTSTIELEKTYESTPTTVMAQVTLNEEQKDMLAQLIKETTFQRITARYVQFIDRDRYVITAAFPGTGKGGYYFRLESYGGEFIYLDCSHVTNPDIDFIHLKLRIQNDEWKQTLEAIIALSDE